MEILHRCVAVSGTHISLISLQRTRLATSPAIFSHTLVLSRASATNPHQPSSSQTITNQQVLPSNNHHPPFSSQDYLGALAQGLSSGHSSCLADSRGNIVFVTSSGSLLVTGIVPVRGSSSLEVRWIPESHQQNTTLSMVLDMDTPTDNELFFAQAQVAPLEYTHPTSTYGLSIHILGNHFDQQTWALDAMVGTPRTMAYSQGALYVLGMNRVVQVFAVNWSAKNITLEGRSSQQTFSTHLNPTQVLSLSFLPQDCVYSGSDLFSVASGRTLYLLCSSARSPYRIFIVEQGQLMRTIQYPWSGRLDSISVATKITTRKTLLLLQGDQLAELELETHRNFKRAPSSSTTIPFTTPPLTSPQPTSPPATTLSSRSKAGSVNTPTTTRATDPTTTSAEVITPTGSSTSSPITFTTSSSLATSPSVTPTTGDGQSASDRSSGMVGGSVGVSAIIATLLLTFVYCRYVRKRRTQAKIERIMHRNEPPQIVMPDPVYNTTDMTPPVSTANLVQHQNNSNTGCYPYRPLPPFPAEQQMPEEHEMAHIEMQRQQLAPPPLIAHSMEGIAQPMAPPVSMTGASEPPRSTTRLTSQEAPSSILASPPRQVHPFARFQDPFGTQQFQEGHDVFVYGQKQPQPQGTYGLPQQSYYPASSSSPSQAGSSSGVPGRYGYQAQPSPKPEKGQDRYNSISSEMSAPPPPYIESIALQLNGPSAPSPSIPSNEPPTGRG